MLGKIASFRSLIVASVAVLTVGAVGAGVGAVAGAQGNDPVVSIERGPATSTFFVAECSDIAEDIPNRTTFVLTRTGDVGSPLTVTYTSGSTGGKAGEQYAPLPGELTFDAGDDTAIIEVDVLDGDHDTVVELRVTVQDGAAYVVGESGTRSIEFVSHRDPALGPFECGYRFTADGWNTLQEVGVGQPLHAMTLEQLVPPGILPADGAFSVRGGALPAGVTLRDDGSFGGVPTAAGTAVATVRACRPAPPGTCADTVLTVIVTGSPVGPLPRTG